MLPTTFTMHIRSCGRFLYELAASQVLPLPRERAFVFFEDPRNLFDITPDWLQFMMRDREQRVAVVEGAEFDYTIRWLGATIPWRSRIVDYHPPDRFTDVQLQGPYRAWSHVHTFEPSDGGTLLRDTVTYRLPCGPLGRIVHGLIVRRQLQSIFRYRALRIDAWAKRVLSSGHGRSGTS